MADESRSICTSVRDRRLRMKNLRMNDLNETPWVQCEAGAFSRAKRRIQWPSVESISPARRISQGNEAAVNVRVLSGDDIASAFYRGSIGRTSVLRRISANGFIQAFTLLVLSGGAPILMI